MSGVPVSERRTVDKYNCTCEHGACERHPDGPPWGDNPRSHVSGRDYEYVPPAIRPLHAPMRALHAYHGLRRGDELLIGFDQVGAGDDVDTITAEMMKQVLKEKGDE